MRAKTKNLSDLESHVLRVVCDSGDCTTDQIRIALQPGKELADSTIRTLLHRLELKGYVSHRIEGRSNVYTCVVAPDQAATRTVRHVIERFFQGSAESFLLGLVNDHVLSEDDLAEVVSKLADSKASSDGTGE